MMRLADWTMKNRTAAGLAAALGLCLAAEAGLWIGLSAARGAATRQRGQSEKMQELSRQIRETVSPASARRGVGEPGALAVKTVEPIAQALGLTPHLGARNSDRRTDGAIVEQTVRVAITAVSRQDLSRFLFRVEALGPSVRTSDLNIKRSVKQPALVDADVTFSALEPAKSAAN